MGMMSEFPRRMAIMPLVEAFGSDDDVDCRNDSYRTIAMPMIDAPIPANALTPEDIAGELPRRMS
jgi:hypothetical protein